MILIWLVRLRIGVARPRALGSQRFTVGPGPTWISLTVRVSSWSRPPLSRALATADLSIFSIRRAALRGVSARTLRASPAALPRMASATCRALRGDVRRYLPTAFASMFLPVPSSMYSLTNPQDQAAVRRSFSLRQCGPTPYWLPHDLLDSQGPTYASASTSMIRRVWYGRYGPGRFVLGQTLLTYVRPYFQ